MKKSKVHSRMIVKSLCTSYVGKTMKLVRMKSLEVSEQLTQSQHSEEQGTSVITKYPLF